MGCHTLGRARRGNSGYNGLWTPGDTNTFDNEFYCLLVADDIVYQNVVCLEFHNTFIYSEKLLICPYKVLISLNLQRYLSLGK